MNLEVDVTRVQNIVMNTQLEPRETAKREQCEFANQINLIVRTLKEQSIDVPLPVYTRENLSVIIRYLYYNGSVV